MRYVTVDNVGGGFSTNRAKDSITRDPAHCRLRMSSQTDGKRRGPVREYSGRFDYLSRLDRQQNTRCAGLVVRRDTWEREPGPRLDAPRPPHRSVYACETRCRKPWGIGTLLPLSVRRVSLRESSRAWPSPASVFGFGLRQRTPGSTERSRSAKETRGSHGKKEDTGPGPPAILHPDSGQRETRRQVPERPGVHISPFSLLSPESLGLATQPSGHCWFPGITPMAQLSRSDLGTQLMSGVLFWEPADARYL